MEEVLESAHGREVSVDLHYVVGPQAPVDDLAASARWDDLAASALFHDLAASVAVRAASVAVRAALVV